MKLLHLPCLAIAGALLSWAPGCASAPRAAVPVHVSVSMAGVISFQGQTFPAEQLPRKLRQAGIGEGSDIRVHMEDARDVRLQRQLTSILVSNGYRVFFLARPRGISEVPGDPGSRTEAPIQHGEPPTEPQPR